MLGQFTGEQTYKARTRTGFLTVLSFFPALDTNFDPAARLQSSQLLSEVQQLLRSEMASACSGNGDGSSGRSWKDVRVGEAERELMKRKPPRVMLSSAWAEELWGRTGTEVPREHLH